MAQVNVPVLWCVICVLFFVTTNPLDTYKAGLVNIRPDSSLDADNLGIIVHDAVNLNLDILLVPSTGDADVKKASENYEETVKSLSVAAKNAKVYLVADVVEKKKCSGKNELVRNNLVFDRNGDIISIYRKPLNTNANCNITFSKVTKFATDFGVDFVQLFEEDLVLLNLESYKDVHNFVVAGSSKSEIQFLNVNQFAAPWAFVNDANVITTKQIIGFVKIDANEDKIIVANLNKYGSNEYFKSPPMVKSSTPSFPGEDLSQYVIRPLDPAALGQGLEETVCHGSFCCQFYIKASAIDKTDTSYGLAVFEGTSHYGYGYNIGTQICAVVACATQYKRTCAIGSENNSKNVKFEEISVTGNFTNDISAQYPMLVATVDQAQSFHQITMHKKTSKNNREITMKLLNANNVLSFGVFGRDYSKDSKVIEVVNGDFDFYDYVYNDDVIEFFDYLWIRFRILFVVVSIYVLEMM